MTYTQVELRREVITGERAEVKYQIVWIPTSFATLGRVLHIHDLVNDEDGWEVTQKYAEISAEYLHQHKDDYQVVFPLLGK